jgi:hypothetical protein
MTINLGATLARDAGSINGYEEWDDADGLIAESGHLMKRSRNAS